jgi:hypothetical protein
MPCRLRRLPRRSSSRSPSSASPSWRVTGLPRPFRGMTVEGRPILQKPFGHDSKRWEKERAAARYLGELVKWVEIVGTIGRGVHAHFPLRQRVSKTYLPPPAAGVLCSARLPALSRFSIGKRDLPLAHQDFLPCINPTMAPSNAPVNAAPPVVLTGLSRDSAPNPQYPKLPTAPSAPKIRTPQSANEKTECPRLFSGGDGKDEVSDIASPKSKISRHPIVSRQSVFGRRTRLLSGPAITRLRSA